MVPIVPQLLDILKRREPAWVTPPETPILGLTDDGLKKRFIQLVKLAGLPNDGESKVTPHTLRHSFASHLVMKGTPLYTVAALLGHTDSKTTEIYAHLAPQHLQTEIGKLEY